MRFSLRTFILLPLLTGTNFIAMTHVFKNSLATPMAQDYFSQRLSIMLLALTIAASTLYILVRMIPYIEKLSTLRVLPSIITLNATTLLYILSIGKVEFQLLAILMIAIFIASLPKEKKSAEEPPQENNAPNNDI